jgi:hypothetical protein
MRLLLVGVHTRPAVISAKRLGHEVFSVDYFGSKDVREAADLSRSIVEQKPFESMGRFSDIYSDEKLMKLAEDMDADGTILTSTLDIKGKKVLGTPPRRVKRVKDKAYQIKKLERKGFSVPWSHLVNTKREAVEAMAEIGFPAILKPATGGGGKNVRLIRNGKDIPDLEKPHIVQEFIGGRPISISTLSTGRDVVAISSSRQILGSRFLNQSGFTYCGSVVPFEVGEGVVSIAEEVTKAFKVKGWTGVDFVLGKRPYFVELNPRFQGTLDCIEGAYGINLVDAHIRACLGELIEKPSPSRFSVRMTLFAKNRIIVKDNACMTVDVPFRDVIIERGEPVTTVVSSNDTRSRSLSHARSMIREVKRSIHKI